MLHVDRPHVPDDRPPDRAVVRERRHVERCLPDVETALDRLRLPADPTATAERAALAGQGCPSCAPRPPPRRKRLPAPRPRSRTSGDCLLRYREFFQAFETLIGQELTWPDGQAFYVVLRAGAGGALASSGEASRMRSAGEVELIHRELSSGEWAVLILTSSRAAPKVSALLSASRVEELPAPAGIGEKNLLRAMPAIKTRLAEIRMRCARSRPIVERSRRPRAPGCRAFACSCATSCCGWMHVLRVFAADYLFVIEGWLPAPRLVDLEQGVQTALGPEVVVSAIGTEDWPPKPRLWRCTIHRCSARSRFSRGRCRCPDTARSTQRRLWRSSFPLSSG